MTSPCLAFLFKVFLFQGRPQNLVTLSLRDLPSSFNFINPGTLMKPSDAAMLDSQFFFTNDGWSCCLLQ
jgi:hypothetical protein